MPNELGTIPDDPSKLKFILMTRYFAKLNQK